MAHPEIESYLSALEPFSKHGKPCVRDVVRNWDQILHPDKHQIDEENYPALEQEAYKAVRRLTWAGSKLSIFAKAFDVLLHEGYRSFFLKLANRMAR